VLLRAQRERVHVDTSGRRTAVVLVRLHAVEIGTLALRETVLAVELELGDFHRVLALAAHTRVEDDLGEQVVNRRLELSHATLVDEVGTVVAGRLRGALSEERSGPRHNGTGRQRISVNSAIRLGQQRHHHALRAEVIGVVERLGAANGRHPQGVRAINKRVALHHPEELLHRVIEVQLDLVGRRRDRLSASVLHLLDEVLVALLGETAALLRVEVHVVNIQRRGGERLGRGAGGGTQHSLVVLAVLPRLEVHIDANLVVLEGNQGDRKTRVAAEPELQRNVQRLRRGALARHARHRRLSRSAGRIQGETAGALHEGEVVRLANDGVQRGDRTSLRGELGPDLHPVTILAIDALAANLNLNLLDEAVANVGEPAESRVHTATSKGSASSSAKINLGKHNLHVRLVHEIGVAVNHSRHALVEVGLAVEGNLNRLHGEVGMALVQHLPEGNLGVT